MRNNDNVDDNNHHITCDRLDIDTCQIVAMWTFLCMFTGVVACLTAYNLPRPLANTI